jgi:hypothetical protein
MYHANPSTLAQEESLNVNSLLRSVQESRVVDASKIERLPSASTLVSGSIGDLLSEPVPRDLGTVVSTAFALFLAVRFL